MRAKDLIVGGIYRHKDTPNNVFAYAKVLEIIPPKTGKNKHNHIVVKCAWGQGKNFDNFYYVKYFLPKDLKKINTPKEINNGSK